jgi:hypothetical protein
MCPPVKRSLKVLHTTVRRFETQRREESSNRAEACKKRCSVERRLSKSVRSVLTWCEFELSAASHAEGRETLRGFLGLHGRAAILDSVDGQLAARINCALEMNVLRETDTGMSNGVLSTE